MTGTYRLHMRSSSGWGWLLAYGVLVAAVGALALFNPWATGTATGLLIAIGLAFYGVIAIATAMYVLIGGARWLELLLGIIALLAAAELFAQPIVGALFLVSVVGLWLVISAAFHIISAIRLPIHRGWRLTLGIVELVLGALLLFDTDTSGLFALSVLVGLSFLSRGLLLVMAALALRRGEAVIEL